MNPLKILCQKTRAFMDLSIEDAENSSSTDQAQKELSDVSEDCLSNEEPGNTDISNAETQLIEDVYLPESIIPDPASTEAETVDEWNDEAPVEDVLSSNNNLITEEVLERLSSVSDIVCNLNHSVQILSERRSESDHQAETLRMMSERVKRYEDDFVTNAILKPVMQDFILLYDSIYNAKEWLVSYARQDARSAVAVDVVGDIGSELKDAMTRHGLSIMEDTGEILNPSIHKVVRVCRDDSLRDGEIVERVRPGWKWNDAIMRAEEVVVNRNIKER